MRAADRALLRPLVAAGALLVCPACGGSASDERDGSAGGSIRLADLLEVAEVRTPLTGLPAARGVEDLEGVAAETVFAEDFEQLDVQAVGWPRSAQGDVVDSDRGRSFVLRGRAPEPRAWVVPAEPNTHYVFERSVRAEAPLVVDFEVIETDQPRSIDELLGPQLGAGRSLLKLHWAPEPVPDGTWQTGSVSFHTMSYTRALVVVLWGTSRRAQSLPFEDAAAEHAPLFDDLSLTRLEPTPEQAIALLKAKDLAEDADPALGMRKHGQFPPLYPLGGADKPLIDNHTFRYALYAPPPTELGFPLTVPRGAALRFAVCLSRETPPGDAARFEVLVRAGGRERSLWSRTLAAEPAQWRWHDERVDLSAFAGEAVTLVLRTSAERGAPHPLWGHPVVDSPFGRAGGRAGGRAVGPRHVVLIAVDTLRADRLSSYGYPERTSPHIDSLAADGVRFDQVASNSTWTCPSFASIFTGVVPSRHGVWVTGPMMRLPRRFDTLAERFRAHGWATHAIAYKAPLYGSGYDQGFDVSFNFPIEVILADQNLNRALDWLQRDGDRRSFLFLHFNDPHQPFCQPDPFVDAFGPVSEDLELPLNVEHLPPSEQLRADASRLYDGAVAYVDDRIGAFLEALRRRGLYDDSVIAFVSDHGEELWEHGGFGHSRGKTFDEAIRVPLIVKPARGTFPAGRVVRTQVRAFDVMPTLLELAGIPVTPDLDAESLVPLLDAGAEDAPDRLAVAETVKKFAVRTREWKYVLEPWRRPAPLEALFDLRADPGERENVAAERPDVVRRMRLALFDYLMLHRRGRYLVALGDGTAGPHEIRIRGVETASRVHGLPPGPVVDGAVRFAGESAERLIAFAQLGAAGPVVVEGAEPAPRDFVRYRAGDLERLLDAGEPGLHLFEGPSPVGAEEPAPANELDLGHVETLRALGYLGEEE